MDIACDGRHLSAYRGFLKIEENGQEVGRIALDDVSAVVVHAHGITYSNNLLVALAERNVFLVVCGSNHLPVACAWPLSGHHAQGARMRSQVDASRPLCKQLWRSIVVSKIRNQAAVLDATGARSAGVQALATKVRSGDPDNVEAQASRRYWPLMFGDDFRRDRRQAGLNGMLNYGYTVVRATAAHAAIAAGLHPTIGIHHRNRGNDMALADDLVEPFRPFVDACVRRLSELGETEVTSKVKRTLASLTAFDLPTQVGVSPLSISLQRLASSLAKSFEKGSENLELPLVPTAIDLAMLTPKDNE